MDANPHNEKTRPTNDDYQPHGHSNHPKPSNSDLLSSAKIVADAVMHRGGGGESDFDKGKVADAAADILHAASEYGKFGDKPMGKMVGQAEDYLHKYNTSHSSTTTTTTTNPHNAGGHSTTTTTTSESHSSNLPGKEQNQGHSSGGGGGGYGDYMKMAEGLFNKNSGTEHGSVGAATHSSENSGDGGNKYGEYLNMAEGMYNKYSGGKGNEHGNTTGGQAHNSTTGGDAPSGGQHGKSESGGYGEYAKLAGDFLKKH